jgi:transcription elongation factor Elf1
MAEIKLKVNCTYCGERNTVTMTFKDTKYSRTIKVSRCEKCKKQNGVKAVLTDPINEL